MFNPALLAQMALGVALVGYVIYLLDTDDDDDDDDLPKPPRGLHFA